MKDRIIRIRLKDEVFRKYKVYCAMNDLSMTDQTNIIIKKFVEESDKMVKIVKVNES